MVAISVMRLNVMLFGMVNLLSTLPYLWGGQC